MAEGKINGYLRITDENRLATYSGRRLSELDRLVSSHETTLSSHGTELNQRTYRRTYASASLNAGQTVNIKIPNSTFGLLMVRCWRNYMEVFRQWSIMDASRWAYSANLLIDHNYTQGGNAEITLTHDSGGDQVMITIKNTGSNTIDYWVMGIVI